MPSYYFSQCYNTSCLIIILIDIFIVMTGHALFLFSSLLCLLSSSPSITVISHCVITIFINISLIMRMIVIVTDVDSDGTDVMMMRRN